MNTLLAISSVILGSASLLDGFSTVYMLKRGNHETNPLFSKHPSTLRVFGEGTATIAAEITLGFLFGNDSVSLGYLFAIGFLVQSAIHIKDAIHNYHL